jgi:homoserine kinase
MTSTMITRPDFHIGTQEIRGVLRPNYTLQDIDSII